MADIASPTPRHSLTKKQLQTELGAELLSLCQGFTADGALTADEMNALRTWLAEHPANALPSIAHLRGVLNQVLADGKITPEETVTVHKALEAVLPAELRKSARDARRAVEKADHERNRPIYWLNFMVAGARYEGRPAIIERHVKPGNAAILHRDRQNVHSRNAIAIYTESGHQIGFVPEVDARECAAELDAGAKVNAVFTKVLTGGRSPIPVVDAKIYPRDSEVPDARQKTLTPTKARGIPLWVWWLIAIVAVIWWIARQKLGS
jgi:hypothetical protein